MHHKSLLGRFRRWVTNTYPKPSVMDDTEWGNALKAMARRRMETATCHSLGSKVYTQLSGC